MSKQRSSALAVSGALPEGGRITDKKHSDTATLWNGSDAAFAFLLIEVPVNAGVHIDLPRDMAQEWIMHTRVGHSAVAGKMYEHPVGLRNMVTLTGNTRFFSQTRGNPVLSLSGLWLLLMKKLDASKTLGVV